MRNGILCAFAVLLGCGPAKLDIEKDGGLRIVYEIESGPPGGASEDRLLDAAVPVIERRLRELDLSKYAVSRRNRTLLVDLPGSKDPGMVPTVKRVLGARSLLALRLVDEAGSQPYFAGLAAGIEPGDPIELRVERAGGGDPAGSRYLEAWEDPKTGRGGREFLAAFLKEAPIPQDRVVGFAELEFDEKGEPYVDRHWRTYLLHGEIAVSGSEVRDAFVASDEATGVPCVSVEFDETGTKQLSAFTAKNVGRRMAVQIDDRVYSAPVIAEAITTGRCQITLDRYDSNRRLAEIAENLAMLLRAGPLPAQLAFVEQRVVRPR